MLCYYIIQSSRLVYTIFHVTLNMPLKIAYLITKEMKENFSVSYSMDT